MHLTQGTFSYLPALSDEEIAAQVRYALDHEWSISIEHTDDPHPRNVYWEMWALPMFDVTDVTAVLAEVNRCRRAHPQQYVKLNAYDRSKGRQTTALSFIVNRPAHEPGFRVERQESSDRRIRYTLHAYAADKPTGHRYEDFPVNGSKEQ
ncbi:MAG: ribulose bisphosphate carboxylase small subunit [Candidatus Eremiobacter antarcticus]|nr:ribulose bisphosphate carboxylase small subunit [Candidatus Eremiobacteraeota bacterium]MBC5807121.1 ribulose bisphosphate carboxylase small subunit [Candidatus Eremiobacteraeota bacterium]PZR62426.1 MAG: ribulose bisphosphate carboxylase small subunit [Candidatus Eremiobacter sp. RRmetagenome_bin22]